MQQTKNSAFEHNSTSSQSKRLYRSDKNKVFAGICGGLGEYFNVDPVAIRLLWVLVTVITGVLPGIIAYIVAIFIIPHAPRE
jgi:phage shock protein C